MSQPLFIECLSKSAARTETLLQSLLADEPGPGESARPARLLAGMRHAVLAGGKRLRPYLTMETARLFGHAGEGPLRAGAAIELLHCYSLVHDDLPAMDDDDLRRGRPTVHRAFDEATAILVGDALLTLSFEVLLDSATDPDATIRANLALGLAKAAGMGGMVGGQMLDLAAEGRYGKTELGISEIQLFQGMKTGALLAFAVEAGATIGRASSEEQKALHAYGRALGSVFQIADDLLDRESSSATAGKRTGKDLEKGKATLVDRLGMEGAHAECARLVETAFAALIDFDDRADNLRAAVSFAATRSM